MQWFFNSGDDGVIYLRARIEGEDDIVAHASDQISAGGNFYGVPYDQMRQAGSGIVDVDETGNGKLKSAEEDGAEPPATPPG
jgi:hypothetical protein